MLVTLIGLSTLCAKAQTTNNTPLNIIGTLQSYIRDNDTNCNLWQTNHIDIWQAAVFQSVNGVPGASAIGNVLGLDLYVDYQAVATTIDDSAFIIVPSAVTWYESPTSYFSVNNVTNGQVQTMIYGYGSLLVKNAGGIRKFNVA